MEETWYILTDQFPKIGVAPVLVGTRDGVIANQLRRGILDAHIFTPNLPYDEKNPEHGGFSRTEGFCALPEHQETNDLIERREMLRLRRSAFRLWRRFLQFHLTRDRSFPEHIEWIMEREVRASTLEKPSQALLDYAHTSERDVRDVYQYFKMSAAEHSHRALMIHALSERFAAKINACHSADDIAAVKEDMRTNFRL